MKGSKVVLVACAVLGCGAADDTDGAGDSGDDDGASDAAPGNTTPGNTMGDADGGSGNADASADDGNDSSSTGAPPQVLPCDGLGPVGEWQEITPPELDPVADYRPAAFDVDPMNSGVAYVGTDSFDDGNSKGVFRTQDCGATWEHINNGTNGDALDGGRVWFIMVDFEEPQVLYANSGYFAGGIFKSTNGGVDWMDVTPTREGLSGFVGGPAQMDPEDPKHILIRWHATCGPYEDQIGCFSETKNGGETWTQHYRDPPFAPEVMPYLLHGSTWIATVDGLIRTTDGGETWTHVSDLGAGGHSAGGLYRSATGAYYIGTAYGVLRSDPESDGATWAMTPGSGSWVKGIMAASDVLYVGAQNGILTSPESDGTTWTPMATSPPSASEGCGLAYDEGHHLMYATCGGAGLWRAVVP